MWNTSGTKKMPCVFGKILRGIERDENIREQSFDARFARLSDNGIGKGVSGRHDDVAQIAEPCAALAHKNLPPPGRLRRPCSRHDLRQRGRRRFLKISERLASR